MIGKDEIGVSKRNIDKEEGGGGEAHHSPSFSCAFVYSAEQEEDIGVSKRKTYSSEEMVSPFLLLLLWLIDQFPIGLFHQESGGGLNDDEVGVSERGREIG